MSIDKAVDSTQLDTDLTTVANAIRSKGGTSAQLSFPAGMAQAIAAIQTGITPSGNIALSPTASAQTGIDVSGYATASVAAITKELLASLNSDFVAGNIKKDVDLFGLVGTLEGGGGGYPSGFDYFESGMFTPASNISTEYTIRTNLFLDTDVYGVQARNKVGAILFPGTPYNQSWIDDANTIVASIRVSKAKGGKGGATYYYNGSNSQAYKLSVLNTPATNGVQCDITVNCSSSCQLKAGNPYRWAVWMVSEV